mgnify:CR=1 FL=1
MESYDVVKEYRRNKELQQKRISNWKKKHPDNDSLIGLENYKESIFKEYDRKEHIKYEM